MIEAKVCLMGVINVFRRTIFYLFQIIYLKNIYIITSQIILFVQKKTMRIQATNN